MDAERIEKLESNVDLGAAAVFAGAVGYAVWTLMRAAFAPPVLLATAAAAGAASYFVSSRALRTFAGGGPRFSLPVFEPIDFVESEPDELLLTDSIADELLLTEEDRLTPGELVLTDADRVSADILILTPADRLEPRQPDPLVLDDILAELGPDSRVVRLFDPAAMPTPGQLKGRIDDHLRQGAPAPAYPDAAQALSDALAELRRSLR